MIISLISISLDRLLSKTKLSKDEWYFKNSFYITPEFSLTTKNLFFFIKSTKKTILQQVTGGNIPNLVLKRMLENCRKNLQLKKILEFQD